MGATLKTEDGREFKINESLQIDGKDWVIDGKTRVQMIVPVLLHRHLETPDGTILVSSHRHDYKTHLDANGKEYMIDGGNAYLRCSANGDEKIFTVYNIDTIKVIREYVGRGGYGKDGTGEYRQSLLKDMSDDWVLNSITYVMDKFPVLAMVYQRELDYRKDNNITIED